MNGVHGIAAAAAAADCMAGPGRGPGTAGPAGTQLSVRCSNSLSVPPTGPAAYRLALALADRSSIDYDHLSFATKIHSQHTRRAKQPSSAAAAY